MIRTQLTVNEAELTDRLLPLVEGRVFHVSLLSNLPAILTAGAIQPNIDGTFDTTFGYSTNSYFRNRGCVSIFDWRTPPPDENYVYRCWPFPREVHGLAIFILSPAAYTDLLPWTRWKSDEALGEMIAPYVEAGYKGAIPLALIDEVIEVVVQETSDPCRAALLNGRKRNAAP